MRLRIQRRFRRIQIFRLRVRRQGPPAESDDLAPLVPDRKHQTAAESIVSFATIVLHEQAACHRVLKPQVAHQAGRRRVTEAESLDESCHQPAAFPEPAGRVRLQSVDSISLEIRGSLVMDFKKLLAFFRFLVVHTAHWPESESRISPRRSRPLPGKARSRSASQTEKTSPPAWQPKQ